MKEEQVPPCTAPGELFQTDELRCLMVELKRVTDKRDILGKAAAYFAKQSN